MRNENKGGVLMCIDELVGKQTAVRCLKHSDAYVFLQECVQAGVCDAGTAMLMCSAWTVHGSRTAYYFDEWGGEHFASVNACLRRGLYVILYSADAFADK